MVAKMVVKLWVGIKELALVRVGIVKKGTRKQRIYSRGNMMGMTQRGKLKSDE